MSNTSSISRTESKDRLGYLHEKKSYLFMKRFIDIVAASFGIVLLCWLFFLLAILIKLEDPKGPVFFKQKRLGKKEKEFYMFKFRSMVSNAEELLDSILNLNEVSGAMFKIQKDPRVTKVGKFIRRTSIDELPQLWNVLKGDMSLVGPRPPLPREVVKYTDYDKQRLLVTPGCTGLWQVSGRNDLSFKEMVELDIIYIKNRSVMNDLKIIIKTFKIIFSPNSAY
ncbi:TPA: sugar transferase BpsD [Bacillus tropicus]|uniref:sugar transferase BpsD n=1 Tax=Bacillus cereus group TaxID=86661 RepID=UPI00003CB5D2|nr:MULTISPECIES: sugar transferase BpsD [Bacillus cereus group]EAL15981.1 glycosyl transferase, putative [Bacillus cereus G9241]QPS53461.1 sugar transferase [Bacillus tropicus]